MKTFIDEHFAGRAAPADIQDWVQRWNDDEDTDLELHEYLGLTWPEYGLWATAGILPMAATRLLEMKNEVLQGGEVIYAHGPGMCIGFSCPVHWPSRHHMRRWPQHWRSDRGIMERICPEHSVGHPDPDDSTRDRVHGCCGCCTRMVQDDDKGFGYRPASVETESTSA